MATTKRYGTVLAIFLSMLELGRVSAQPVDTFDATAESWATVGKCPSESSPGVTWSATGGNPGGCIKATDNSVGVFYWIATGTEWKNDLSAYYGCNMYFELKTSNTGAPVGSVYDIVIIRGDDETITYNTTPNPGLTYTSYTVPLSEGGWIVDGTFVSDATCPDLTGPLATAADMIAYLSDVKRIRVRAEFGGLTSETNYMDNAQIVCDPLPLPVEMTEFNGWDLGNGRAQLEWVTASETNCLAFQVEKSLAADAFDSIGFVYANGTTTEEHTYTFTDPHFTADAYYRLKQINMGHFGSYSKVVPLTKGIAQEESINIYPNPTSDITTIAAGTDATLYNWSISDLSGRVIISGNINDYEGWFKQELNVSNWESGIYMLKFQSSEGIILRKFEVVH